MSTLFDISSDEPVKKPTRRRLQAVVDAAPAPPPAPLPPPRRSFMLGRIDGHYQCLDEACGAWAMDILDAYRGEWAVQCAFCETMQTVPAVAGVLKERDDFVLNSGRFAGMTLDEVAQEPRGLDYIRWAVAEHPREAVRAACKKHLDALASVL